MDDDDQILALEGRIAELENALGELRGNTETPAIDTGIDPAFYRLLEDRFRGSREQVAEKVQPYVAEIRGYRDALAEDVRDAFIVADLGCGRGEVLSALSEAGIQAFGVDENPDQARDAVAAGLRVEITDILGFLTTQDDQSIDVIVSLHVIEHFDFARQAALLAGAARVLKAGGALILETPNPENLRVGAWKFHIDPTHLKPLPPELLTLMVEHAGFTEIRVARLHPERELDQITAEGKLPRHAALMLYGPRDYAVLARKP
jgi:SAM-dependent methyltransferase